ncbi:MAG: hypothetical protein EOP10_18755 [Proteobacteria bacterium]|nr:MAG: hypothetical protein EOP10_18755 [Pseudomonadota bacterium]
MRKRKGKHLQSNEILQEGSLNSIEAVKDEPTDSAKRSKQELHSLAMSIMTRGLSDKLYALQTQTAPNIDKLDLSI